MSDRFFQALQERTAYPLVMGILNVTPDSFSDGGRYGSAEAAAACGLEMLAHGAAIIDVGAESTRPGANDVPPKLQISRAIPVIQAIRKAFPQAAISIDTRSADVAEAAGACLINDVSALRDDPRMVEVVAQSGAGVVLMHRRGDARTMQADGGPSYQDVVGEVSEFLLERAAFAQLRGVGAQRILLDPGIGFGKRFEDNIRLMGNIERLSRLGFPILIGASRKAFLGRLLAEVNPVAATDPMHRLSGSLAVAARSMMSGAAMVRVHDVRETVEFLSALRAFRDA